MQTNPLWSDSKREAKGDEDIEYQRESSYSTGRLWAVFWRKMMNSLKLQVRRALCHSCLHRCVQTYIRKAGGYHRVISDRYLGPT